MSEHPNPWSHVRAHAAEGGLYSTCLAELCDRVNEQDKSTAGCIVDLRRSLQLLVDALGKASERLSALEARPEVQVLRTTPQEGGPTLLAPIGLQQGAEPAGELLDAVTEAIVDGMVTSDGAAARFAILAVAEWLIKQKEVPVGSATASADYFADMLREEVERG